VRAYLPHKQVVIIPQVHRDPFQRINREVFELGLRVWEERERAVR